MSEANALETYLEDIRRICGDKTRLRTQSEGYVEGFIEGCRYMAEDVLACLPRRVPPGKEKGGKCG